MIAPHLAIEEIHSQLFAPAGPVGKPLGRTHEPVIPANFNRHIKLVLPVTHRRKHAVFAGFSDHQMLQIMARRRAGHLTAETATIVRVIKADIIHGDSFSAQTVSKVPHR